MMKDILKQMIPFFILLAVLWLMAVFIENTFSTGSNIVAEPRQPAATPAP